jgi:hypothetical protein
MHPAERLAANVDRTLASLPGEFARIVYLASLRDAYSGRYLHEGWAGVASPQAVHDALQARHNELLTAASALSLDSLAEQVERHFATLSEDPVALARLWLELEPFREALPAGASPIQREFFISQMRLALRMIAGSLMREALPVTSALPPPRPARQSPHHPDSGSSARPPATSDGESE